MKKARLIMGALTLAMSVQASAKNMVLTAEEINCGGVVTVEKTPETLLVLRVNISNNCQKPYDLTVDSQNIKGSTTGNSIIVQLDPHLLGPVLPITVGNQSLILRLSEAAQAEVSSSNTSRDLQIAGQRRQQISERERQYQEEIRRDEEARRRDEQRRGLERGATTVAVVGIGAAVTAAAVTKGER